MSVLGSGTELALLGSNSNGGGSERGLIITSRRTTWRFFPRTRKRGDNTPCTVLPGSSLSPEKNRLRTAPLSHPPHCHWASLRAHRRVKGAFSSMMMERITRLHTAVSWWLSSLLACVCPRLSSLPLITHPHSHSEVPSQITPYCWRKIGLSSRRRGAFQHRHNGPDARQWLYVAHPQKHHHPPIALPRRPLPLVPGDSVTQTVFCHVSNSNARRHSVGLAPILRQWADSSSPKDELGPLIIHLLHFRFFPTAPVELKANEIQNNMWACCLSWTNICPV